MRRIPCIVLLVIVSAAFAAERIDYAAPEFMQSIYDQFSVNYLNAEAVGRGHTGVAVTGDVYSTLINPAGFRAEKTHAYIELFLKPSITEMNTEVFQNNRGDEFELQNYSSENPFGIAGVGIHLTNEWSMGFIYACAQTLEYNSFNRPTQSDDVMEMDPSFSHIEFVTANSFSINEFGAGLNIIVDYYSLKDYRNYWELGRDDETCYLLRLQPGVRWEKGRVSLGASYVTAVDHTFNLKYGETYDTTIPASLTVGGAYRFNELRLLADIQQEWCSGQSSDFDDRTRMMFGIEIPKAPYTFRMGCMSVPGVYEGEYSFPGTNNSNNGMQNYEIYSPKEGYDWGNIDQSDQLFITGGVSYAFASGALHVGAMADVLGDVPVTQLYMSFSLNLSSLKKHPRSRL